MKKIFTTTKSAAIAGMATFGSVLILSSAAFAVTSSGQLTAAQQSRLTAIQTKGDQEIARRLTSLNKLTDKINSAGKLTATSKTSLVSEVNSTIDGLNTQKSTLDTATTLTDAKTAAQQILTDYRVYALVVPKVHLVKLSDDIQAVSAKLTTLSTRLQARIDAAKTAGKAVATLQTQLDDMKAKITDANTIASGIETGVIGLQPTDYNSNHQVLAGDMAKLKTARTDNIAAFTDAKNIVTALKSLK